MKKLISIILAAVFLLLFSGCGGKPEYALYCSHEWERIENVNEYTASDKCLKCGMTRIYTDPDHPPFEGESGYEAGLHIKQYNWDGYGISSKDVFTCDLGYAILDLLASLKETGQTEPRAGKDEAIDETTGKLPVTPGTMWLECGTIGLYRLSPDLSSICRAESHLGKGEILEMTPTLKTLISQAWNYYPYDCWAGTYENGKVTLNQVFKSDSAVETIRIDDLYIQNKTDPTNKITLTVTANEDKNAEAWLISQASSDNLALGDQKDIQLLKDRETTVELSFGGFKDRTYYVTIRIDNTRFSLTVNPQQ